MDPMVQRKRQKNMIAELHDQIAAVQRNLAVATQADMPYEAYLHRARLEDLRDMADRHGIDVSAWLDPTLPPLALAEG
jgi:hypothetical protein